MLEHIPLKRFFRGSFGASLVWGLLLVTNMHSDMEVASQAVFVESRSGMKIRLRVIVIGLRMVEVARGEGFEVVEANGEGRSGRGWRMRGLRRACRGRGSGWDTGFVWGLFQEGWWVVR